MRIRHIEIFYTVYRQKSISSAARKLNISQPAVSKALRHAEDQLGFTLFTRTGRGLIPTEQAHQMFDEVSQVYAGIAQVRRTSQELRNSLSGRLKISTVTGLSYQILPRTIARIQKRYPNTAIELQTLHYGNLIASLRDFDTHIGLVFDAAEHAGLSRRKVGTAELSCVFQKKMIKSAAPRMPLSEFMQHPFIALNPTGPLGALLWDDIMQIDAGFVPVTMAESCFVAKSLSASGIGLTVVDEFTARAPGFANLSSAKLDPPLQFEINALTLQSRPLTKIATDFILDLEGELLNWRSGTTLKFN